MEAKELAPAADNRIYFHGLSALRFFAAAAVIITHVELLKRYRGYSSFWSGHKEVIGFNLFSSLQNGDASLSEYLVNHLGTMGVVFFFVLSGFLITYLLLVEKKTKGSIALWSFYKRRIYRIWPLYYFILVLGFFILPHFEAFYVPQQSEALEINFWPNLALYSIIFPNIASSIYPFVPLIGQSWSIGVEEQFYILWPLLAKWSKKFLFGVGVFIALLLMLKGFVLVGGKLAWFDIPNLKKFLAMTKMESMAIGAFGAYILFRYPAKTTAFFTSYKMLFGGLIGLGLCHLIWPTALQDGLFLGESLCFLALVMHVGLRHKKNSWTESKALRTLGNISYGLYMYHFIAIAIVLWASSYLFGKQNGKTDLEWWQNILLYAVVFALSIAISYLSYRFLELPFIKRKSKFSPIRSGEEARG